MKTRPWEGAYDENHLYLVHAAGTDGVNYDVSHEMILARLEEWMHRFLFTVTHASRHTIILSLHSLPNDLDAFARELYEFCPDIIDQGYEEIARKLKRREGADDLTDEEQLLIEGIDLRNGETRGLQLLRRSLELYGVLRLWWD